MEITSAKALVMLDEAKDNYMSVKQASEEWGLSTSTVKRWCEQGIVISFKVLGRWMIVRHQKRPWKQQGVKR